MSKGLSKLPKWRKKLEIIKKKGHNPKVISFFG
jgi:hypothetical protein